MAGSTAKAAMGLAVMGVVLIGVGAWAIEVLSPAPVTAIDPPVTPRPSPSTPSPSVVITADAQGVVPLDQIADVGERGFLTYLTDKGIEYPTSYAALVAGRRAAPAVCSYYNAKQRLPRDGQLLIEMSRNTPEWAKAAGNAFSEAVQRSLCDGTAPRR
ncbi:hypothetical protein [Amycolatopsis sp. NPDC059021]|uniref:hypothetical protein n=1 Tax=Amycolatopsis sp. NPDC059021 TaxID=3346704 RepID=UPI00366DFA49